MKNLYVLPTSKPSRIQLQMNGDLHIENGKTIALKSYQNIYITSDGNIKQGTTCYCISNKCLVIFSDFGDQQDNYKKIILTTNKDLINDGVQAINDEFLEWFVKNQSCKEVEVLDLYGNNLTLNKGGFYKIIITKEEPKQKIKYPTQIGTLSRLVEGLKQETIEEVAENIIKTHPDFKSEGMSQYQNGKFNGIIEGIKWQKGRSYSEEELFTLTLEAVNIGMSLRQDQLNGWSDESGNGVHKAWFEQFKK